MSRKKDDPAPLAGLSAKDRKFVEGICAGMSAMEAAKYAGSRAKTDAGLASLASRWKNKPRVAQAIKDLRDLHAVDDDGLWSLSRKALRELLQDRANPAARARACELMAKLLGKLAPDRHEHIHAQIELPELHSAEGKAEMVRLVRIALQAMPPDERAAIVREAVGTS